MKLITYALFNGDAKPFEKTAYIRGFCFNVRMNRLLYPEWTTHLEIDKALYWEFKILFDCLVSNLGLSLNINDKTPKLCEGMFWRTKSLFDEGITHIICRDADSITTYREASCVAQWIHTGLSTHAILDNPAHAGMMGGMVGFNTQLFKTITGFSSWSEMVAGFDLSLRGSDQHFMNQILYPKLKHNLLLHRLNGAGMEACATLDNASGNPNINPALWESDLTCRHIGSAGVVEMETLRFFQRFDKESETFFEEIEKRFPKVFYWRNI